MEDLAPLCVRCGYAARGLESPICPECGVLLEAPARPTAVTETIRLVAAPRRAVLELLWRDGARLPQTLLRLAVASTLIGAAMVWLWLIDPIRGALSDPIGGTTVLFHLVFVLALGLTLIGAVLLACEHAAVLAVARLLRFTHAGTVAWRISSISTIALMAGAAVVLGLVTLVKVSGWHGPAADLLPIGGVMTGVISWFRSITAGLWAAGLLRDAGW
ncbi:MAG: hypothetical protein AAGB48_11815 [Planctomycetota bacterium]